jgi:repressor of nif and glnA expression
MSDFAKYHGEHIRLSVLKLLAGQSSYSANDSLLTQGVSGMGLTCTRDAMRVHLQWLDEQGLVTTEFVGSGKQITVAKLTERGGDVASGATHVPGVQRPAPGA